MTSHDDDGDEGALQQTLHWGHAPWRITVRAAPTAAMAAAAYDGYEYEYEYGLPHHTDTLAGGEGGG